MSSLPLFLLGSLKQAVPVVRIIGRKGSLQGSVMNRFAARGEHSITMMRAVEIVDAEGRRSAWLLYCTSERRRSIRSIYPPRRLIA